MKKIYYSEKFYDRLPQNVKDSQVLNMSSKKVLAALLELMLHSKAKETQIIYCSCSRLRELAGVGMNELQRAVFELLDHDLITRQVGDRHQGGKATAYTINFDKLKEPIVEKTFDDLFGEFFTAPKPSETPNSNVNTNTITTINTNINLNTKSKTNINSKSNEKINTSSKTSLIEKDNNKEKLNQNKKIESKDNKEVEGVGVFTDNVLEDEDKGISTGITKLRSDFFEKIEHLEDFPSGTANGEDKPRSNNPKDVIDFIANRLPQLHSEISTRKDFVILKTDILQALQPFMFSLSREDFNRVERHFDNILYKKEEQLRKELERASTATSSSIRNI